MIITKLWVVYYKNMSGFSQNYEWIITEIMSGIMILHNFEWSNNTRLITKLWVECHKLWDDYHKVMSDLSQKIWLGVDSHKIMSGIMILHNYEWLNNTRFITKLWDDYHKVMSGLLQNYKRHFKKLWVNCQKIMNGA